MCHRLTFRKLVLWKVSSEKAILQFRGFYPFLINAEQSIYTYKNFADIFDYVSHW